jgi:hypothetical protein
MACTASRDSQQACSVLVPPNSVTTTINAEVHPTPQRRWRSEQWPTAGALSGGQPRGSVRCAGTRLLAISTRAISCPTERLKADMGYAPGAFVAHVRRKAENAGAEVDEFPTVITGLSQVCSCWAIAKMPVGLRWHARNRGVRPVRRVCPHSCRVTHGCSRPGRHVLWNQAFLLRVEACASPGYQACGAARLFSGATRDGLVEGVRCFVGAIEGRSGPHSPAAGEPALAGPLYAILSPVARGANCSLLRRD